MTRSWLLVTLLACNRGAKDPAAPATIVVTSAAFAEGASISSAHTCDGKDEMPPLAWSAPPAETAAIAIVVDDPDAPGGTFTHFLAWNLEASARAYTAGTLGKNDYGKQGWSGPCPPRGKLHHYRFRVLALGKPLALGAGASRAELDAALEKHVLAEGTLTGTFQH